MLTMHGHALLPWHCCNRVSGNVLCLPFILQARGFGYARSRGSIDTYTIAVSKAIADADDDDIEVSLVLLLASPLS